MGSHGVKRDVMGFQGGVYGVPGWSRGMSVGCDGVKGDVKGSRRRVRGPSRLMGMSVGSQWVKGDDKGFPGVRETCRGSKGVKGDIRGSQAGVKGDV